MTMYRFLAKPKWLAFSAMVLAAVVLMINLGFWQLRRLNERRVFNRLVAERTSETGQVAQEGWLGPTADVDTAEWHVVNLSGRFEGRTDALAVSGGYQLISPIELSDGSTLLINRGGIDVTADIPPPPAGDVQIVGRVRRLPLTLRNDGGTGTYVEAISSVPEDGGVTALPLPVLDEANHLSYALQWFTFAVCVLVGWILAIRRTAIKPLQSSLQRRRNRHQAIPWRDIDR
jgi:surfeit locus 1 family protein